MAQNRFGDRHYDPMTMSPYAHKSDIKKRTQVTTEEILKHKILQCIDVSLPDPINSTNEERVAYLTNMRTLHAIQRVFDNA